MKILWSSTLCKKVIINQIQVIVTSHIFPEGSFSQPRLDLLLKALKNGKDDLVIDLSCRKKGSTWFVAMDKWQTITDFEVTESTFDGANYAQLYPWQKTENIQLLEEYCSEFLVHAADNEGLQKGIDEDLVESLGKWCSIPVTYAGGAKDIYDLDKVAKLSHGRVDLTIGSALDIFGGSLEFSKCIDWNENHKSTN